MREYTGHQLNSLPLQSTFFRAVGGVVALLACLVPVALAAQSASDGRARGDTTRTLAPGVSYRRVSDPVGPWRLHIVRVDLRHRDLALQQVHGKDALRGRERTSTIARRHTEAGTAVLAAINADFFDLKSGENENNQVIGGEWWKGLKVTDSPFDTYDNVHVQFAIDADGHPQIDRFILDGMALVRGAALPILSVNAKTTGTYEGTALFTSRFGAQTPGAGSPLGTPRSIDPDAARDTSVTTVELPLVTAGHRGDTLLFVRRGPISTSAGTAIPTDGAVLTAFGPRITTLRQLADGDTVRVLLTTVPRLAHGAPQLLIGGWPQLLHHGQNVAASSATIEGTISRNAEARHPRTAIGYSRDRKTLWLVVVDGRSTSSVGMTVAELADALKRLGAWDAMNFDGGGSTTMVIDGAVVNSPTDPTGEREVGNVLLLLKKR